MYIYFFFNKKNSKIRNLRTLNNHLREQRKTGGSTIHPNLSGKRVTHFNTVIKFQINGDFLRMIS